MKRSAIAILALLVACGGGNGPGAATPVVTGPAVLDSLWDVAQDRFRHGDWSDAATDIERLLLEFSPGDPRIVRAHFILAESYFGMNDQIRAAREFRRVSDDFPTDSLAPEALLRAGDAYADLWRRPELDPTYGQTALATYQELLNRYPNAPARTRADQRIAELNDQFAAKQYKAAQYYVRLKAWDSAILYLRDLLATWPRAEVAPEALVALVGAYRAIGYSEEVQETCGYFRQNYPGAPGLDRACPDTTS